PHRQPGHPRRPLPPRGARPPGRDARADVPGSLLGRTGYRGGGQRDPRRRSLAAEGGTGAPPGGGGRRHPPAAGRGGGHPGRPRPRGPGPGLGAARPPAPPHRPGDLGRVRRAGGRMGRRPGDGEPAGGRPSRRPHRLPRGRRPRPGRAAAARVLGAHRGGGGGHRPRPVAEQRLRRPGGRRHQLGPGLRRDVRARPAGRRARAGAGVGRPRPAPGLDRGVPRRRLRRHLPAPRRAAAAGVHRHLRRARAACRGLREGLTVRITDTSDLWWKSAVIYCLDVETYLDSDGDGCGDLEGLAHRIDYLAELGINCLWLMPFYPSPDRDDGYDITDYYGVDPRLGNHGQLVEVIRTAHDRGIRVIADLVVNHTSDQHPWFRKARRSKDNPYRDYYVWRDTEPPDTSDQVVFPDQEEGIWTYDERTGEWYLHHFYSHQPDLNISNPRVREEILRTIGFWLELGIDGFRMDAVPFFLSSVGDPPGEDPEPHTLLRETRAFVGRRKGSAMLLGEVNLPQDQLLAYFGGDTGGELDMMFDFTTMQATYLSLAREDTGPLLTA